MSRNNKGLKVGKELDCRILRVNGGLALTCSKIEDAEEVFGALVGGTATICVNAALPPVEGTTVPVAPADVAAPVTGQPKEAGQIA